MRRGMKMKAKLMVTVDSEPIPRAERYAKARGVSLSALVEASLGEMTGDAAPSFSTRWRGRFKAAAGDASRYGALACKYLRSCWIPMC